MGVRELWREFGGFFLQRNSLIRYERIGDGIDRLKTVIKDQHKRLPDLPQSTVKVLLNGLSGTNGRQKLIHGHTFFLRCPKII